MVSLPVPGRDDKNTKNTKFFVDIYKMIEEHAKVAADNCEKIHKLEEVADMSIDELIRRFAEGWSLTREPYVNMNFRKMANMDADTDVDKEALRYIEAQLEGGYVDLDSDLYYGNELDIIREAIKLYKESKGVE